MTSITLSLSLADAIADLVAFESVSRKCSTCANVATSQDSTISDTISSNVKQSHLELDRA